MFGKEKKVERLDAPLSMMSAPGGGDSESSIKQPEASEYKGKYRNRKDGYLYKHCVAEHAMGKTHKAIVEKQTRKNEKGEDELVHTGLFWEGTPEEFRDTFDKE